MNTTEYGKIINGELVRVPETEEGAKRIVRVPFGEFDQLTEMVVFSHFAEDQNTISVHPKIVPVPEEEPEEAPDPFD